MGKRKIMRKSLIRLNTISSVSTVKNRLMLQSVKLNQSVRKILNPEEPSLERHLGRIVVSRFSTYTIRFEGHNVIFHLNWFFSTDGSAIVRRAQP